MCLSSLAPWSELFLHLPLPASCLLPACQGLRLFSTCVATELVRLGGYLADSGGQGPGCVTAAFRDPRTAALWAWRCILLLKEQPW
jgi:hypothetical protein